MSSFQYQNEDRGPSASIFFHSGHRRKFNCEWLMDCEYVPDHELFDHPDLWQHPVTFEAKRQGDCEDHCLWAWRKFRDLGIKAEFVVGKIA